MAIGFNSAKGSAIKSNFDQYEYKNGENRVRLVGDLLPRYVYWVKGENNKSIPMECLSFDRTKESFTNVEKDWVREYFPDMKCGWAYAIQCIDLDDGKVKVLNLKKKLMEQIKSAAEDLGDPTDIETGFDVVFKKAKTGPNVYNVEYTLQVLRCKNRPLTDEERAAIKDLKSMEEVLPRPTVEAQKALLERITAGNLSDDANDPEIESAFDL
jgi:hypothetical protein